MINLLQNKIYKQIRLRRKQLSISQKDMEKLIGLKQAQYQKIESGGNCKLKTLERILKVLKLKMVLVPQEKLDIILPLPGQNNTQEQHISLLDRYQVIDDE